MAVKKTKTPPSSQKVKNLNRKGAVATTTNANFCTMQTSPAALRAAQFATTGRQPKNSAVNSAYAASATENTTAKVKRSAAQFKNLSSTKSDRLTESTNCSKISKKNVKKSVSVGLKSKNKQNNIGVNFNEKSLRYSANTAINLYSNVNVTTKKSVADSEMLFEVYPEIQAKSNRKSEAESRKSFTQNSEKSSKRTTVENPKYTEKSVGDEKKSAVMSVKNCAKIGSVTVRKDVIASDFTFEALEKTVQNLLAKGLIYPNFDNKNCTAYCKMKKKKRTEERKIEKSTNGNGGA